MSDFENLGLKAGTWSGLLHRAAAPAQAGLVHNGERVAEARIAAAGEGIWRIDVDLPAERLGDGVTSFLLFEEVAGDEAPVGRESRWPASRFLPGGRCSATCWPSWTSSGPSLNC